MKHIFGVQKFFKILTIVELFRVMNAPSKSQPIEVLLSANEMLLLVFAVLSNSSPMLNASFGFIFKYL